MRFPKIETNAFERQAKRFLSIAAFLFMAVSFFMLHKAAEAAPTLPPTIISYQGKVLSSSNTPISTALSFQFLLYDAPTAGNLLYTAAGSLATPAAISITPSSGIFAVNLGDTGTNQLDENIFRTHNAVYLEVVIGAETLTPRRRVTAAPYALNALSLNGYVPATVSSSVYIPLSDSQGNFQFNGVAAASSTLTQATINNLVLNGMVSGLSLGSISGTGVLGYLANSQSFTGLNTFSATTTFSTTTVASTTIVTGNITSLNAGNATINNLLVSGSCTGCLSGAAQLASGQTFTGLNVFTATTTFTTSTIASSTLTTANITNLLVNGTITFPNNSITDAMIPDTITVSNYLLLAGGTLAGNLALGNNNVTGVNLLTVNGLGTLSGGFLSSASSTVNGQLHVVGGLFASSTLQVDGLALLSNGFIAGAASTVNGSLTTTGALNAQGTLAVTATSTFSSTTAASSSIVNANITNLSVNGTVSGITVGSLPGSGLLAYLANDQTLTGLNTFSATSTFSTSTIASSTITNANVGNLGAANATVGNLVVNGTCTGCLSGAAMLASNQTFTGTNTFNVTTTFNATSSFARAIGISTSTSPTAQLTLDGGNLLAVGTHVGSGPVPYSGAGTRLMWIPSRSAFRAGYVNGSQWDAANVGVYSTAFGENNTVAAGRAFGAGTGNTIAAAATGAVVFGGSNSVSVTYSGAFGVSNTVNGGGAGYAFGMSNTVSGASSAFAFGQSNTSSGGTGSTAIGNANAAGGTAAIALGSNITVNGNRSVGIGLDTVSRTMTQNNAMSIMGGNVGIGTLSPGYTLAVTGTLAVSATSTFTTTTAASSTITNLNVASGFIGTLTVGSCSGCGAAGGGASLSADQTFTGQNTFTGTTVFTSTAGIFVNTSTSFLAGRFAIDSNGNIFTSGTLQVARDILPISAVSTSTAVSTNATSTSSTLSSTGDTGAYPSAIVGGDGLPFIAYYSSTTHGLMATHCTTMSCSGADSPVQIDGFDQDVGMYPSVALGSDGFPVIAYYNVTSTNLRFAKCKNFTCSQAVTSTLDASSGSGTYPAVVIGSDGNPLIAYNGSSFLSIVHCRTLDCSSYESRATSATPGLHIKMVVLGDGNPFISYTLPANKVVYMKCPSSFCMTVNNSTDLSNAQTATNGFGALITTRTGSPLVIYYNGFNTNDIRTRGCGDPSCSSLTSETQLNTLPSGGQIFNNPEGPWITAALASDGNPMFAYLIYNGGSMTDPVIVHCKTKLCDNGFDDVQYVVAGKDSFTYSKGMSLIRGKDGVPMLFFYKQDTGDLMMWRGCVDGSSQGGCTQNESVAYSGSSLGSRGQYFYQIFSREIYAKQAYLSGFDLAESYLTDDQTLKPGDVVAFDQDNPNRVVKADVAHHPTAVGIVSTKPGLLLTEWGPDDAVFASGTKMVSLALAGRVPVVVSGFNGTIKVGDKLSASNIPGVATKALPGQPTIGIAMENFYGANLGTITAFVNIDTSGSDTNSLHAALTINTASSTLTVGSSSTPYDLALSGNLSLLSSGLNTISFAGTALLNSGVADVENARAFILNAQNITTQSPPDRILFSLRAHDTPVFSVAANGDVQTNGNYFGASAVFGSSTNPGDLAERVDIASDDTVEAGDVMIVDPNNSDTYRRSRGSYDATVAGVISSNPTIVVGKGKTDYTANLAMVGRVPVKVVNQNGAITRGDLLVASSEPGYAMRYDPTLDNSQKMVGVIGIALDPLVGERGKIAALVRTGWAYSQNKNITALQSTVAEIAAAAGIDLDKPSTEKLHVETKASSGELVYSGGNLNLRGNSILNVASLSSPNSNWSIDAQGHFITKITTPSGEQTMYAMQSPSSEFVFSSSSALVGGKADIVFDQLTEESIDPAQPLKVTVTLTSEGAQGVYVSQKSAHGFTVKEIGGGQGNATFDWIVVARRRENIETGNRESETTSVIEINSSTTQEVVSTTQKDSMPSEEGVIETTSTPAIESSTPTSTQE